MPLSKGPLAALQRIGTALLAVILQQQTRMASSGGGTPNGLLEPVGPTVREHLGDPLVTAFGHTPGWAALITAAAIVPAALLACTKRSDRPWRSPGQSRLLIMQPRAVASAVSPSGADAS